MSARVARRERGTALIEFALMLPLMLALTFCVVDISRAFWAKNAVTQAAREGVRHVVVSPVADSVVVRSRVQEVLLPTGLTLSTLTVSGPLPGPRYEVEVGVAFDWLFPGLFNWLGAKFDNPMTVKAKCVMRKEG
jgi:hypothetical protein